MKIVLTFKPETVKLIDAKVMDVIKYEGGYYLFLAPNQDANVVYLAEVCSSKERNYSPGTLRNIRDDADVIICKNAKLELDQ